MLTQTTYSNENYGFTSFHLQKMEYKIFKDHFLS